VPFDKLKSRDFGNLTAKKEDYGPNENRFLNINKSPKVLSTVKNVGSPDFHK
jgi:hypothetical protein